MQEVVKLADASRASDYVFEATVSEPRVKYWQVDEEQGNAEEVNVPRAKRRLLKGLGLPVKEMFTVDLIPTQVHVDPQDIATALESREEVDQADLEYWKNLSKRMSQRSDTLVTFGVSGGELYLAREA